MDELKQTLLNSEVSHEILQFLRGNDPVEELLALAEATDDTRMIVIGSRRRSPSASSSWVRPRADHPRSRGPRRLRQGRPLPLTALTAADADRSAPASSVR